MMLKYQTIVNFGCTDTYFYITRIKGISVASIPMSYDGIGLKSAKGSATSGHIQQSLALNTERRNVKNYLSRVQKQEAQSKPKSKTQHKDKLIIQHLSKRELELRVSEYRDTLEEDESLSDSVIEAKCEEFRKKLAVQVQRQVKDEKLRNAYVSRAKRGATDASSDAENSSNSHSSEGK